MKIIDWQSSTIQDQKAALLRPIHNASESVLAKVQNIIADVKRRGDDALHEYSKKFDGGCPENFLVNNDRINRAVSQIDPALYTAINQAKTNITRFHEAGRPQSVTVETMPGVVCTMHWRAIPTVGIYIPGGTAPLFSTVLMQAIPAQIAGCTRIVLCTPARDLKIHPAILAAAHLCGISEIYAVGGAQAIAAMAYGTETIPKVDKICGPGNVYVTMAKQLVSQDPFGAAIDMPAGPSEVMVLSDAHGNPSWIAADLLAQGEHDVDAQAIFVTTSSELATRVQAEVDTQLMNLPRRAIAEQSIKESRILLVPNMDIAIMVANEYGPEHLIIHNDNASDYLNKIQNAGSVFLGAYTPESAGDYASGTNHVLPTYGYARTYNGINVLSFMKSMTSQSITPKGLDVLGATIIAMAKAEGLDAHAAAVQIRMGIK